MPPDKKDGIKICSRKFNNHKHTVVLFMWHYYKRNQDAFRLFATLPFEVMVAVVEVCEKGAANNMREVFEMERKRSQELFERSFEEFCNECKTLDTIEVNPSYLRGVLTRMWTRFVQRTVYVDNLKTKQVPQISILPKLRDNQKWQNLVVNLSHLHFSNAKTAGDVYSWASQLDQNTRETKSASVVSLSQSGATSRSDSRESTSTSSTPSVTLPPRNTSSAPSASAGSSHLLPAASPPLNTGSVPTTSLPSSNMYLPLDNSVIAPHYVMPQDQQLQTLQLIAHLNHLHQVQENQQ